MIKWVVKNDIDVDGPDPKNGISMTTHDTGEDAIYQRFERFINEKQYELDVNKKVRSCANSPLITGDGCEIPILHVYYYTEREPERQIHSVFTAWPVEV